MKQRFQVLAWEGSGEDGSMEVCHGERMREPDEQRLLFGEVCAQLRS